MENLVQSKTLVDLPNKLQSHVFTDDNKKGRETRISYVSFGSLATKKVNEKHPTRKLMNVTQAAEYIKWVIDAPENINVNELHLDPVQ